MKNTTIIQEQPVVDEQLQIKAGLLYKLKAISPSNNAKENSFKRMLYSKHPERPRIELQFEFTGLDCQLLLTEQKTAYQISFQFSESYLQSFSPDDNPFAGISWERFTMGQEIPVCCNTQMMLHEIINSKHEGVMEKIFLESKALALFLCTHHCYSQTQLRQNIRSPYGIGPDCSSCKFLTKPYEKEKIFKAKEILLEDSGRTITIQELSREVGINQCYLKKGFKELFGTTIFDFIKEHRIDKAKMLLSTTDTSVTEIAHELGYSNVSNFSNAFKKQTGILPSEFQRN